MSSCKRMSPDQIARLALAICATAEVLGQLVSSDAAELMADDLADYPPEQVAAALKACRRELTGRLNLAAILQRVQSADGRPGKDEAWAIALTASDEHETVVMTSEIQQALAAAHPVLALGDKVGARMAFISAYERLVTQRRAEAKPAEWSVSLGFDPGRRVIAIESAMRAQLITQEAGQRLLADLRIEPITADGQAIAGLLTGSAKKPSAALRARWQQVRDDLEQCRRRKDIQRRWDARRERRIATARRSAQIQEAQRSLSERKSREVTHG